MPPSHFFTTAHPFAVPPARGGFTLVELSIVLVIIGLLMGGVMTGQLLIRGSELQSVLVESNNMIAATNAFQAKYDALPGDMRTATSVWGKSSANCSTALGVVTTPGTCNGDGNGKITTGWNGVTDSWPEMFRFWQQLNLAGLLKGQYSGVTGPSSAANFVGGINAPVSRYRGAVYGVWYANTSDAPATTVNFLFAGSYGTFFLLGGATNGHPWGSVFTPSDAHMLDLKADDGFPGRGKIVSNNNNNSEANGACATSAVATSAQYMAGDTPTCILMFRNNF